MSEGTGAEPTRFGVRPGELLPAEVEIRDPQLPDQDTYVDDLGGGNGWAQVEYTYDGQALNVRLLSGRPRSDRIPCAREVGAALRERGSPHWAWAALVGHGAEGLLSLPLPHSPRPELLLERTDNLSGGRISIKLRLGCPAYSMDLIGDGSQLVSYTYDGLATRIDFQTELPVFIGADRLPMASEVASALQSAGIGLSDGTDRPQLLSVNAVAPNTIEFSYGLGTSDRCEDLRGDKTALLYIDAKGDPVRLSVRRGAEGLDLSGLPSASAIERILRHNSIPFWDSEA